MTAFLAANNQLRLVQQYYQYEWDDTSFTLDEHTWLKYTGAYKNLRTRGELIDIDINPLVGKTKLVKTQIIDAEHILNLIGNKVSYEKGIQTIDSETLRLIYQQIQELSDLGDDQQAKLLKEFVDTELVPGKLSSDTNIDELFEKWKLENLSYEIENFASDWGINEKILSRSFGQFSVLRDEEIPYIDDISRTVDFKDARNKEAGNQLKHVMTLINKELPQWLRETKGKYE